MTTLLERPVLPSPQDAELALQASRMLAAFRHADANLKVQLDDGKVLTLPRAATHLLHHLLTEMAQGNAVTIIPMSHDPIWSNSSTTGKSRSGWWAPIGG